MDKAVVHLGADHLDECWIALPLHLGNVCDALHLADDSFVVGGDNLRTVAPEDLIAVVLLGVVRGGHHDATLAAELTDRIGDHRGRAERIVEVDFDAVCREHVGGRLREEGAVVSSVVSDSDGDFFTSKALQEVVGQSLRRHADGVLIHTIGAGSHDATQTSRAKL